MSDLLIILVLVAGLLVLDVTAILFGYDSRDGFNPKDRPPFQAD
jgi:hypothetical protein